LKEDLKPWIKPTLQIAALAMFFIGLTVGLAGSVTADIFDIKAYGAAALGLIFLITY
jgi:hypothetical protein